MILGRKTKKNIALFQALVGMPILPDFESLKGRVVALYQCLLMLDERSTISEAMLSVIVTR